MSTESLQMTVDAMTQTIWHRGPDDSGSWVDENAGIALGHRRLSILDLSPEGHQPMVSANGRYVLIFNGEVYNFLELKQRLQGLGHTFRGHSDTEVMLASFCQWGLDAAVQEFNGMFAFCLWDRQARRLYLGRDRLGEKPLYYGWLGETFIFASELKALSAHPNFQPNINRAALTSFLKLKYIPTAESIYEGIYKLPAGTILSWSAGAEKSHPRNYWSLKQVAESGRSNLFMGTEQEAINQLDTLLRDAVKLRMVADVPLGAFLSGGIDSSTIVALMQAQSSQPIKTFTIGFQEKAWNEAQHAKETAQYLGTDHTELYVTATEAMDVIPNLPKLYDEPFADISQIPTFLVSHLARQHVTVTLSGDGGDELFGGYTRYLRAKKLWNSIGWLPPAVRDTTAQFFNSLSSSLWGSIGRILPASAEARLANIDYKTNRISEILGTKTAQNLYTNLDAAWKNPATIVIGGGESRSLYNSPQDWANISDFSQWMMYFDTVTYLPDDILVKLDRASMGASLEDRIPLLDHRVVEFAWRLPDRMKIRQNQGKWLLRQVLYQYIPPSLIERPKMGFGVPVGEWLRGPLRDWAEALLDERRLRQEGFLAPQLIRQRWHEHLAGYRNWQDSLWNILMFQAWFEHQS